MSTEAQSSKPPTIVVHKSPPQYQARDFRLDPICATSPKFCFPAGLKVRFSHAIAPGALVPKHIRVVEAISGNLLFTCEGKAFSFKDKKVLRDKDGKAVLNTKRDLLSITDSFKIFARDHSEQEICKVTVTRSAQKAKLTAEFQDKGRNVERKLMVKGNLELKRLCVYLVEDSLIPMASMQRFQVKQDTALGNEEYLIDIEAGVDAALMVMLAIGMEAKSSFKQVLGVAPQVS